HSKSAWLLWGLLALHVAGALKHQWLSDDEPVLARMAPGARPGRRLEPRLLAIALAIVAAGAAAYLVRPPIAAGPPAPKPAAVALEAGPPVAVPADPAALAAAPADSNAAAAAPKILPDPARWTVADGSQLGFETAWSGSKIEGRFERFT